MDDAKAKAITHELLVEGEKIRAFLTNIRRARNRIASFEAAIQTCVDRSDRLRTRLNALLEGE